MHELNFPAHTQASMDGDLRGHVNGLDFSARQAILESQDRATIAYGSRANHVILHEDVNLAVLRHYIPKIVNDYCVTSTGSDDMILLPASMNMVTERGLKHIILCMMQEIQQGSFNSKGFNSEYNGPYMVRSHYNVGHSIDALNTLRAFGLDRDADFLGRKDGPIAGGLKLRAQQWPGDLEGLQRYIETLSRDRLEGQDKQLLAGAWAVYQDWYNDRAPSTAPYSKA